MDKIVVGNLKMNMLLDDLAHYLNIINEDIESDSVIICPTNIYIPYFLNKKYKVGLQNIYFKTKGAYTGEVSPVQAVSIGISHVLVGHSERRIYFNETDYDINNKVIASLNAGLKVILCVGETSEERNLLKTAKILKKQINIALKDVTNFGNIIIAYEPVWAISTNIVPSNNDIRKTILYIKNLIKENFNYSNIPVLYGGSITSKNISLINQIDELDGVVVGNASTNVEQFVNIINIVSENKFDKIS